MADDFYYVEGSTSVKDIIKNLTKEICEKDATYKWKLIYPVSSDDIKDKSIIEVTTLYDATFYLKMERTAALTPTSEEQKLLDKEANSKPFTLQEYALLKRHIESLDFTSTEISFIKKDPSTLSVDEQNSLTYLRNIKNVQDDREMELLRRYYLGQSMSINEQNELEIMKNAHELTAAEVTDYNKFKQNRKLYSIAIELVLLKEYLGYELADSEETTLIYYRNSIKLTDAEQQKLALLNSKMDNRNHMYLTIGTEVYDKQIGTDNNNPVTEKELVDDKCSVPARLAWYKNLTEDIGEWLPVQYWLNLNKDSFNLVLRGDPSADNYPYENFLSSYAYVGAIKPMEDSALTDDKYNFAVTTSSDIEPFYIPKFGQRTATGITDVCMVGNKVGMPYQPHYPGFYSTNPYMDKCNTEGSRWNHKKHQFSDITLVHPVDMERGKMQNVLVGDASAIYDGDRLVYKKGEADEEMYKKFKITSPYYFLNNSTNVLYCLAIRCFKTTE